MRVALLLLAGATSIAAATADARDRRHVSPYIELAQVVDADLTSDDAVTYTEIAVGVDAAISGARAEGQASVRYERRVAETRRIGDDDVVTGLARGSYRLARPLSVEAGALATRARADIRGAAPGITDTAFNDNISQVYALYAGPTLATNSGALAINGAYRFGYTKVQAPRLVTLAPGAARQDYFDHSTAHDVELSAGIAPNHGALPIGVTVSGGYDREQASQLGQRYEGYFGRGDLLVPVAPTLAVTGGVGYQKITVSQRDALRDASGAAVTDRNGRYVTDPASPRRIAYNTDGLIYDAGVVWRPSPRTSLTATVAHQYDSTSYTGAFGWRNDRGVALGVSGYDEIETFGRQLRTGLQGLPTDFQTRIGGFGQQFNGCVYGGAPGGPGQGAGGCLNDAFQSVTTASYRARGVNAVLSAVRGRNRFGIGAGYENRRLFAPLVGPGLIVQGVNNDSYFVQGFYDRALSRRSSFDANVFANWYDSGPPGASGVFGAGATGAYSLSFGRLGTTAQVGVYTYEREGFDDQWNAQALLGARYQF